MHKLRMKVMIKGADFMRN